MMRRYSRRFLPALVIAFVLGGTAISQAQIVCTIPCPVWDISALLKNIAINSLKAQLNEVGDQQYSKMFDMATRLAKFTPLKKFFILDDDMPEWRIHCWWAAECPSLYALGFLQAMTYGDASGEGYTSVSIHRELPVEETFLALTGEAQETLGADMAVLDIRDSSIIRGTHETGRLRFNGREEARTISALQDLVTDESDEQSLTAVMDKISAAGLIEGRSKQGRIQFLAALLEQMVVDNMDDRNSDTEAMNMMLNQRQDGARFGRAMAEGTTDSLVHWQLP